MNWKPLRKIVAAGLSGLTATGVIEFFGDATAWDPTSGVTSLIVTAASALAGYLTPEHKSRRKART